MTKTLLVVYLLAAMKSWVPVSSHSAFETEAATEARYASIASDIADVALDPHEQGLLRTVSLSGHDASTGTAVLLAAVASYEGGYQLFVDDGTCNRPGYKADRRGGCDGGMAWSIWQIHTFGGLVLTADGGVVGRFYAPVTDQSTIITGPELIRDRKLAARLAAHIMRNSLRQTGTLCLYTGESSQGTCNVRRPLADSRLGRAVQYLHAHAAASEAEVLDLTNHTL